MKTSLFAIAAASSLALGILSPSAKADHYTEITVVNGRYVRGRPVYHHAYVAPRPVYVVRKPVYVERPVYVAPASVEVSVQRALAKKGYYGGPIDGDIGPGSRAAIRAYQVDRGLPVTGRIDGPLLKSLHLL
jgi:hypothetical protein